MARTLDEHIKRYQSAYATFGLLGLSGDRFRLDHKACFVPRKTISAKAQNEEQQSQRDGDAQIREVDLTRRDLDLIRQLHEGKRQRLFITGEGGIGKTEFTRLVALELANQVELQNPAAVPWRFELKELNGAFENAKRFVEQRLAPHDHHWLLPLAESGKVVFIFDGLDELGVYGKSFLPVLREVIELFAESSFVLAGRPGSLEDLSGFPDDARHTLQPLTMPEIRRYVLGVFGRNPATAPLGQQLIKEFESKRNSLFPIIQQPLMLALACRVFSEPNQKHRRHVLPANPAELVEQALPDIFDRRDIEEKDHDRWLDALSTLAAFTLIESGDSVSLSTSRERAKRLLRENLPLRLATDGEARRLLDELAPACGVLAFENGQYIFTNRVLAEFLAARWIVRLGYPNWPYREQGDDPINSRKPYTRLQNERERQIMDFLGDHVWTINRSGLVQAVHFELGRTLWGGTLLICQARWILEQIKPFYSGKEGDLDVRSTLISRIFRCLQACLILSAEDEGSAHSLLKQLFSYRSEWHKDDFWTSAIALIPTRYSDPYLDQLRDALEAKRQKPKENHDAIGYLANAMARGWPGNDQAFTSLDAALKIARGKPTENQFAIGHLANAMARGWPGNDQAFTSLDAVLKIARGKPTENEFAICDIVYALAKGWPGDDRALNSLNGALAIARDKPAKSRFLIWGLAGVLAWHWPGNGLALTSLDAALMIAREKPKNNGWAIWCLAGAMARGWPDNDQAFTSLDAALKIAQEKPKENGFAIGGLAEALAKGWAGNGLAFTSIDAALMIARNKPKENYQAIWRLVVAMATGWPGNDWAFTFLDTTLMAAQKKPEDLDAIAYLADAMARGWPENDRAFTSLDTALKIALKKPKENNPAISLLIDAMARNWSGTDHAFTALGAALAIAQQRPQENCQSIWHLADAIAKGWRGNDLALTALDTALTIAREKPEENGSAIGHLAIAMARGWPGQPNVACRVATAGQVRQLNIDQWNPWVVLFADEAAIENLCGQRGEKWGLEDDPELTIISIPATSGENTKPKTILIAPRERIRQGLDPALLAQIWQEREPATFVQPGSPAKRSPKRTGKSRFPNGRIGTSEVRELVRQIAVTLGYDASTLAIIMAWTRSKNGTDMMNGAVEVANAVSSDEQAIVPEADPKTGRLSIESADFITRLGDKAAKKLLAARAAEWANRREVDPWNVSEEDMKNMGSVCPGCGRIDELVRRNKRGEFPVKSPCRSCETKFAEEAICEWPEMCKTCEGIDCPAANLIVRFAYPPPPEGWKNKNRKKECCPQCCTPLSRAMPFNRPKP